jgi:hypothetical protein
MKKYCQWKILRLPENEIIFLADGYEDGDFLDNYNENHNVFRQNAKGEIVWQVRRDDSNHPPDWWNNLDRHAREDGLDGARCPFTYITLKYPDGSSNISPQTGDPPDEATWTPGCTILLEGSAYQQYILDPETGIAKNVTVGRPRPW